MPARFRSLRGGGIPFAGKKGCSGDRERGLVDMEKAAGKRLGASLFILVAALFLPFLGGCVKLALLFTPSLVPHFRQTIFEECDPELARKAIPANLKLLEGLLKNDPENRELLVTLSMGFSGYSLLFVEKDEPERASRLYGRARDYGIRALGDKGDALRNSAGLGRETKTLLKAMGEDDLEALFWTAFSWNAWINLNLDKPEALSQLGVAGAFLERIMEIDPGYMHGLPHLLMGVSLAARPPLLGGDRVRAKSAFEAALRLSRGKFFLVHYYFARYYAVMAQDRGLFFRLIEEIIDGDPHALKDVCLINAAIRHRAETLKDMADEFFL
jgi:hypothetical protein